MNPKQLLAHFDRISEAPDAIPRLRRFILHLAIRGRLVEQDSGDSPATELLSAIRRERDRLIRTGAIKTKELVPPILATEVPFDVPDGWVLIRLGEALQLFNGRPFKPSEWTKTGLPIIRIQNLNDGAAPHNYCDVPMPERFQVRTGDFLISWSGTPGTSFGAHIWTRGPALLNQHIFKAGLISDAFVPLFLRLAINSRLLELIDQAHGGVGLQHITKPNLEKLPLTLPPLAEQHRIVAKVDELMALCDRLEEAQAERESRRDRLVAASLHRLNNAAAPDAFRAAARFHLRHLPRLTTRSEQIQQLRQTILSLAVQGKLVPQVENEEVVTKPMGGSGKHHIAPIAETEIPFEVPRDWRWQRLGSIAKLINGDRGRNYPNRSEYVPTGLAFINTGHIQPDGSLSLESMHYIARAKFDSLRGGKIQRGDLVYCLRGATLGKTAFVDPFTEGAVASSLVIIRLNNAVNRTFARIVLTSPLGKALIGRFDNGSAQPNLSANSVKQYVIPVPPLAEQRRIVTKVDELMALCDRLESQLIDIQSCNRQLLEAVLHETLALVPPALVRTVARSHDRV